MFHHSKTFFLVAILGVFTASNMLVGMQKPQDNALVAYSSSRTHLIYTDEEGNKYSEVYVAIKEGNLEKVKALAEQGADLECVIQWADGARSSALERAITFSDDKNFPIVKYLAEEQNVDTENVHTNAHGNIYSALGITIFRNKFNMIKYFFEEKHANAQKVHIFKRGEICTAVDLAITKKSIKTLKYFMSKGMNLEHVYTSHNGKSCTALFRALAGPKDLPTFKCLVEFGAQLDPSIFEEIYLNAKQSGLEDITYYLRCFQRYVQKGTILANWGNINYFYWATVLKNIRDMRNFFTSKQYAIGEDDPKALAVAAAQRGSLHELLWIMNKDKKTFFITDESTLPIQKQYQQFDTQKNLWNMSKSINNPPFCDVLITCQNQK